MSFVACGVASSFVSLMIMPQTARSCGASGAIFGLYSVCVLGKVYCYRLRFLDPSRVVLCFLFPGKILGLIEDPPL